MVAGVARFGVAAPEHLDEPIGRHDVVRLGRQRRQEPALLGALESHRLAAARHFQRAEDTERQQRRFDDRRVLG